MGKFDLVGTYCGHFLPQKIPHCPLCKEHPPNTYLKDGTGCTCSKDSTTYDHYEDPHNNLNTLARHAELSPPTLPPPEPPCQGHSTPSDPSTLNHTRAKSTCSGRYSRGFWNEYSLVGCPNSLRVSWEASGIKGVSTNPLNHNAYDAANGMKALNKQPGNRVPSWWKAQCLSEKRANLLKELLGAQLGLQF